MDCVQRTREIHLSSIACRTYYTPSFLLLPENKNYIFSLSFLNNCSLCGWGYKEPCQPLTFKSCTAFLDHCLFAGLSCSTKANSSQLQKLIKNILSQCSNKLISCLFQMILLIKIEVLHRLRVTAWKMWVCWPFSQDVTLLTALPSCCQK